MNTHDPISTDMNNILVHARRSTEVGGIQEKIELLEPQPKCGFGACMLQ
jgi:hypothetical protein